MMMPAFDMLLRCLPGAAAARMGQLPPAPGVLAAVAALILMTLWAARPHRLIERCVKIVTPSLIAFSVVIWGIAAPTIEGETTTPPVFGPESFRVITARGRTALIERESTRERFAYRFDADTRVRGPGETFTVAGSCEALPGARNRGEPDWLRWTRERGAQGLIRGATLPVAPQDNGFRLADARRGVHAYFDDWPRETGELARALVLGDRSGLSSDTLSLFRRLGVSHLLALSGLHTGILFGALFTLLQAARVPARAASPAAAGLLWVFGAVAGFPVSLCRSLVMLTFWSVAQAVSIPANPIQILALAALILGVIDPPSIGEPGFLLSFGATGWILAGHRFWKRAAAPHTENVPPMIRKSARILWPIWMGLCASVGTLPLQLVWFGMWAPAGIVWTVILTPLLALTLIASAAAVVFSVVPSVSLVPWADGAVLVATLFFETAAWLGRLTADPLLFEGTTAARIAIAIGAASLVLVARLRRIYTPVILLPALVGLLPVRDDARELVIDILDIGQGSAAVVRVPDGPVLLFDAGIGPAPYDRGASTVLPFLQRLDRLPVDRFYASHGDADHIGGAISLAKRAMFRSVYGGGREGETTASTLLDQVLTSVGIPCASALDGSVENWGAVRLITVFAPEDLKGGGPNDASLVQILSYGDFRLWIGGDASSEREADLAARGLADRVPVLIASHHGARSSTPWSLLARARPQVAVISCGRNNRYGHPHSETVRRLEGIGARIVRTDAHGGVTIRTDGRTMRVETLLPTPAVSIYRLAPSGSRHQSRRVEG